MFKLIFEKDAYTQYKPKQKLQALQEYLDNIAKKDNKKFMKMLVFGNGYTSICNISDIQISKSIADGTAAESDEVKKVYIVYTTDPASKVMKMKRFATLCKKILDELKDVDNNEIALEAIYDGKGRSHSFRFYYDNSKNFALLVKNVNVKGVEKFLNEYVDDLEAAVIDAKPKKIKQDNSSKDDDTEVENAE